MLLERLDHVGAAAPLQRQRFLADHLEHHADALLEQPAREPQRGIVARRQEVVLGIEPEDDVHLRRRLAGRRLRYEQCEQAEDDDQQMPALANHGWISAGGVQVRVGESRAPWPTLPASAWHALTLAASATAPTPTAASRGRGRRCQRRRGMRRRWQRRPRRLLPQQPAAAVADAASVGVACADAGSVGHGAYSHSSQRRRTRLP